MYNNKKYLILNSSEIDKIEFDKVCETSSETLRTSFDGQKTFVKWENEEPEFVSALTTKEGPYTHEEIISILSSDEWKKPIPTK